VSIIGLVLFFSILVRPTAIWYEPRLSRKMHTMKLLLDRSVQFLYEGHLAQLELRSLGCTDVARDEENWRCFTAHVNGTADVLRKQSAFFGAIGDEPTDYSLLIRPQYQGGEFNRTRSPNQYLTHWIYPYRGKFHPQMIRGLFNIMGLRRGMRVGDFFSGSGTTALEATLMGMDFVGADISPLCVLLAQVKTGSQEVAEDIADLVAKAAAMDDSVLSRFVEKHGAADTEVGRFFRVATMVTLSDSERRGREVVPALRKNLRTMSESVTAHQAAIKRFGITPGSVDIEVGDARKLGRRVRTGSVDAVITSPPYSIALDYVENDEHALKAIGLDVNQLREAMTGVRGKGASEKLALYNEDMQLAFRETSRVLRSGGRAAFVIGDATVDGREWTTTAHMIDWAARVGLRLEQSINKIVFGLYSVMKDEKILIFVKDSHDTTTATKSTGPAP